MASSEELAHPLWDQFRARLETASSVDDLTELKDAYLGRQRGLINAELKTLGALPSEERPAAGKRLNLLRSRVTEALQNRREELERGQAEAVLRAGVQDVTLPGVRPHEGGIHPLRRVRREMEETFVSMGFDIKTGPEIESDYYNFEALNIPSGHPARDDQDTFYLLNGQLLRTHTSPVQIRTMESCEPPVRIAVPGRVFRRDAVDATHSPMFHQMEALVVDQGITFADLKGSLEVFLRGLFSASTKVRFRPSYFPFVEPGAEVDISCIFCSGNGCRVCKQSGWIEILGAGMVHPRVFEMVGYDPAKYTGFAWGIGIDRVALLKYQVDDLRLFVENDLRFLRQF